MSEKFIHGYALLIGVNEQKDRKNIQFSYPELEAD